MDCHNSENTDTIEEDTSITDPPEQGAVEGWHFESDHPLLKANPDYNKLLRTLATLEAQRIQTVKDHDTLGKIKKEAMKDPLAFMEKILNGEDVGFPAPLEEIAEIPEIDWTLYRLDKIREMRPRRTVYQTSSASGESSDSMKGTSTELSSITSDISDSMDDVSLEDVEVVQKTKKRSREDGDIMDMKTNAIMIRGRAFDVSKPVTFNQLWSEEEQERLEELLVEFPPEEVEQNRYKKIATALGNRTPQQVTSRIQKYFIKLYKAGLPVPGRSPRSAAMAEARSTRHHHQKNNHMLFRPTTFFRQTPPAIGSYNPDYQLTPCGERVQNYPDGCGSQDGDESEDELLKLLGDEEEIIDLPEKLAQAKEARILRLLEKVKEDKSRKVDTAPKHYGYKCCYCEDDPLEGTRWHCQTCTTTSVDFCSDCLVTQLESPEPHPLSHHLVPIVTTCWVESGYDQDYAPPAFSGGDVNNYNYLDPNFMPL